ncbi:MAG: YceI family protein [Gammaproteobacteria bacterium]|nr:YceI family protein [Gammaproteobacteria bacterium]
MTKIMTLISTLLITLSVNAADYAIDTKGAHASINFKVQHLGFSWLTGRFNNFEGSFSYDEEKPEASKIQVNIDTTSIDSNHAERDKHLRSDDFLNVDKHPKATFVSTGFKALGNGKMKVMGDFTLNGVTKTITIDAEKVGGGKDPWGGYRVGFSGDAKINMGDFNFKKNYGDVWLELHVEGIKK